MAYCRYLLASVDEVFSIHVRCCDVDDENLPELLEDTTLLISALFLLTFRLVSYAFHYFSPINAHISRKS